MSFNIEEGRTYETLEIAEKAVQEEAKRAGFALARRSSNLKGADKTRARFVKLICTKGEHYTSHQDADNNTNNKKRKRQSMKKGCRFSLRIVNISGSWTVKKIVNQHNHDMVETPTMNKDIYNLVPPQPPLTTHHHHHHHQQHQQHQQQQHQHQQHRKITTEQQHHHQQQQQQDNNNHNAAAAAAAAAVAFSLEAAAAADTDTLSLLHTINSMYPDAPKNSVKDIINKRARLKQILDHEKTEPILQTSNPSLTDSDEHN